MSNKKTSFHMGNEFNGYGEKVYLKASRFGSHPTLSQDNVRLTPNYNKFLTIVLGALPTVMNPVNLEQDVLLKALGAIAGMSRVIVKKNPETGEYTIEIPVKKMNIETGSYLHNNHSLSVNQNINVGVKDGWAQTGGHWKYMKSGKFLNGDWIQWEDNWYCLGQDECMITEWAEIEGEWYYFHEDGSMASDEWVDNYYIKPDGIRDKNKIH